MKFTTEQEKFWSSDFGNSYLERNKVKELLPNKINLFKEILKSIEDIKSVIEYGPNTGVNLLALKSILSVVELNAVEINSKAVSVLKKLDICNKVIEDSMINFKNEKKYDLSFTSGVLIHINPDFLKKAYETLYNSSKKYILIIEYYNPTPVTIKYRGNIEKLYKRDFAGDIMKLFSDVKLLDYGFRYKKDNKFPLDDVTWFLLKK
tara:strand:- start:347 stop:964 length:618 start_codon:yes stop_codon:yes gene_type:complete